jgi:hypothetical protein
MDFRLVNAIRSWDEPPLVISEAIYVKPRPVVMVHGFISNAETWTAYLGNNGFLASIGLQGFAAGDGQVPAN